MARALVVALVASVNDYSASPSSSRDPLRHLGGIVAGPTDSPLGMLADPGGSS